MKNNDRSNIERGWIATDAIDPFALENRIAAALNQRLEGNSNYTLDEIGQIAGLDTALFPDDIVLDEPASNLFRDLTKLSQCALAAPEFQSHRKYVGPLIVGLKKLGWRWTKVYMQDAFQGLQEFSARVVDSRAKEFVETQRIKARLAALEDSRAAPNSRNQ